MREADKLESLIDGHWQVMNEFDAKRRIKLVVDEWGPWYKPGSEVAPTHILGQMITQRDAVMSGLRSTSSIATPTKSRWPTARSSSTNLNCLFLADGDNFVTTPVYHVFQMYAAHQGAQAVRAEFLIPSHFVRSRRPTRLLLETERFCLSARQGSDDQRRKSRRVATARSRNSSSWRGSLVRPRHDPRDADIHAHNTFDHPNEVKSRTEIWIAIGPHCQIHFCSSLCYGASTETCVSLHRYA